VVQTTQPMVFISHKNSPHDNGVATQIYQILADTGFKVWLDLKDIDLSDNWFKAINNALQKTNIVIVLITEQALQSDWVWGEIEHAFINKKPLYPIRLEPVELGKYYRLSSTQWKDCFTREEINPTVDYIIEKLFAYHNSVDVDPLIEIDPRHAKNLSVDIDIYRPSQKERGVLQTHLLDRMRDYWINGLLKASLHDVPIIRGEIDLHEQEDVLVHREFGSQSIRDLSDIYDVFQYCHTMLILGAPGAGKTVKLLQLGEQLVLDAYKSADTSIPLILNLAAWSQTRVKLSDWIIDELFTNYHISAEDARFLVNNNCLIYLFDGLDEVALAHRDELVGRINEFEDYDNLTQKLDILVTVQVNTLSQETVLKLLQENQPDLKLLIENDPSLLKLAQIPFNLGTMLRTASKTGLGKLVLIKGEDEKKKFLMDSYIQTRFGGNPDYSLKDTHQYLVFLARYLVEQSQTILMPSRLQYPILGSAEQLWYFLITRAIFMILPAIWVTLILYFYHPAQPISLWVAILDGLILGSIIMLFGERFFPMLIKALAIAGFTLPLTIQVALWFDASVVPASMFVISIALIAYIGAILNFKQGFGNINADQDITPVESLDFSGKQTAQSFLVVFLGVCIFLFVFTWLIAPSLNSIWAIACAWISVGFSGGLIGRSVLAGTTTTPLWGIYRSLKSGRFVFTVFMLGTIITGTIGATLVGYPLLQAIVFAICNGLFVGVMLSLYFGFIDVIKHVVLRWLLHRHGSLPQALDSFLQFSVDIGLMRKLGSNYLFIHRMLRDHLAQER
jgi:TIR domain